MLTKTVNNFIKLTIEVAILIILVFPLFHDCPSPKLEEDSLMKLSSKARYAIEAMLELAVNPRRPVTLASISVHQGISQSYMEQLFMHLRKAGLIQGARGPGGGYRLGREATEITVADVVVAVDERATPEEPERLKRGEGGPARLLWDDLSRQIFEFLGNITLAQLVESREAKDQSGQSSSHIDYDDTQVA